MKCLVIVVSSLLLLIPVSRTYGESDTKKVAEIADKWFHFGTPVTVLVFTNSEDGDKTLVQELQTKSELVLRSAGIEVAEGYQNYLKIVVSILESDGRYMVHIDSQLLAPHLCSDGFIHGSIVWSDFHDLSIPSSDFPGYIKDKVAADAEAAANEILKYRPDLRKN